MRRGFTLIELLVATVVFTVGFMAVFGLFLAGMRFRKLSEDTTRAALAVSSLVAEIRINAGSEGRVCKPSEYEGTGFVSSPLTDPFALAAYPVQPGTWYRVVRCTDLTGRDDDGTTAMRVTLFVLPWSTADSTLDLKEVNKRLQLITPVGGAQADDLRKELVKRGLGFEYEAVITRTPSWQR